MNKHPSMGAMRAGLLYQDLLRAVMATYEAWGVSCTQEEAREIILKSKHRDMMLKEALGQAEGKRTAVFRELGEEFSVSASMVRKVERGER